MVLDPVTATAMIFGLRQIADICNNSKTERQISGKDFDSLVNAVDGLADGIETAITDSKKTNMAAVSSGGYLSSGMDEKTQEQLRSALAEVKLVLKAVQPK